MEEEEKELQRQQQLQQNEGKEEEDPFDPFDIVTAVIECDTTRGKVFMDVREAWAPLGVVRFLELVDQDMFTDLPFFRVAPRYITQFGPKFDSNVHYRRINDDPTLVGKRDMDFGYVFFAGSGTNSRDDQMVISLCDSNGCHLTGLGNAPWETPLATIRKSNFPTLHSIEESGRPYPKLEMPGLMKGAQGPDQSRLRHERNYLKEVYPDMEYFKSCHVQHKDVEFQIPLPAVQTDSNVQTAIDRGLAKKIAQQQQLQLEQDRGVGRGEESSKNREIGTFVTFEISNINQDNYGRDTGEVVIRLRQDSSPAGVSRFIELVKDNFFTNSKFFRVGANFVAQFGIPASPDMNNKWAPLKIGDDTQRGSDGHLKISNTVGTLSFASSGPNTRSSQLFFNLANNGFLDEQGFTPIAELISGEDILRRIYSGYGPEETKVAGDGKGPRQGRVAREGNAYLDRSFPLLSYISSVQIQTVLN